MCHDDLTNSRVRCGSCGTLTHVECAEPCPTLGCARGRRLRVRRAAPTRPVVPTWTEWPGQLLSGLASCTCALVVLVVLTAYVVVVPSMNPSNATREARVFADMRVLHDAAELFRASRLRWPRHVDELGGPGGFLKEYPPLDPWGTPYELRPRGGGGVLFASAGPDRAAGGGDDLSSAEREAW